MMKRSLKEILLQQVEETSQALNEAANSDVNLKVAMTQTVTPDSITIQNYRIDIISEEFAGRKKNFYNIVENNEVIHRDLALFETAMSIVKRYIAHNGSNVDALEKLDMEYCNALYETWMHQSRAKKGGPNEDIALAKAGAAKSKVAEAKRKIMKRL